MRPEDCECEACRNGAESIIEKQEKLMRTCGFYLHVITDSGSFYNFNIHTHGLRDTFNHPDLEIVLNIPIDSAYGLIHAVVDRIRKGERFVDGDHVSNIVKHYNILLVEREETGRKVLRMVLPDKAGNVDEDKIDSELAPQFLKD